MERERGRGGGGGGGQRADLQGDRLQLLPPPPRPCQGPATRPCQGPATRPGQGPATRPCQGARLTPSALRARGFSGSQFRGQVV
eukprot:1129149-Rhodomonas_salina.1